MTHYNSTARVPFAKGGKVDKKPIKPKRIILWKGKVKDWPGAQKAKDRTGKEHGGKIIDRNELRNRKETPKWTSRPGKKRKTGKKQRTSGADKKINPQWLKEKYNVELKADGGRIGLKKGGFPIRTSKLKRGADQEFTLQKGVSAAPIKQSKAASLKEHAKTWPPKGMTIKQDSQKAFKGAIKKGLKNPKDYMYMHTKGGKDFFKHIGTRKYESFKKGGKADNKWIQGVNKSIKKRGTKGVCTGKKFGSASCKPGSRRYNLAKTFKKMARSKHASGGLVRFI
jgi:hypothetical protein